MGKYKRLGRNMIFQAIGKFSSKLLVFLLIPLYTSVMSTEEYGVADYVGVTVTLLYPIITLIIVEAEFRFALDPNEDKNNIFSFSIVVGVIGLLVVLLLSPVLRRLSVINSVFWYFYLQLSMYVMYEIFVHFAIGLDRFSTTATAGVINTAANVFSTVIALVVLHTGVRGYLIANSIGYLFGSIFIYFREKLYLYFTTKFLKAKDLIRRMLKYSIPMVPNSICWWINNSADKYMMEFFCGVSSMALLSVAYKIPTILFTVVSMFVSAWHVSAADRFGTEENRAFFQTIYKLFNLIVTISALICLIFTQELSRFLFKSDFYVAWKIVPVLILGTVFQSGATFFTSVFTANKNNNTLFISTVVGSVINIALNILLIPIYEGIGAAIATLAGYLAIYIIRFLFSRKVLTLGFRVNDEVFSFVVLFIAAYYSYKALGTRLIVGIVGLGLLLIIQRKMVKLVFSNIQRLYKSKKADNKP